MWPALGAIVFGSGFIDLLVDEDMTGYLIFQRCWRFLFTHLVFGMENGGGKIEQHKTDGVNCSNRVPQTAAA